MTIGCLQGKSLGVLQMAPLAKRVVPSVCNPVSSWIWPKTCSLGLILSVISFNRILHPWFPFAVRSPNPKGGPWVMRISVSEGIWDHLSSKLFDPNWNPAVEPLTFRVNGEPILETILSSFFIDRKIYQKITIEFYAFDENWSFFQVDAINQQSLDL